MYGMSVHLLFGYFRLYEYFIFISIFLSFQIEDFETSITRFLLLLSFLSKDQKVKYPSQLLINHPFLFLVNLFIQPPREPREYHSGEV